MRDIRTRWANTFTPDVSVEPGAPVVRLTARVRQRHHFDVVVLISINNEKGEAPQRNPSGRSQHAGAGNDFANQRVFRYELERGLNLIPKLHSEIY